MAAIKLKQLYGGGQFKAEIFSGSLTHSLSSATPLTIAPPAGKTLRLDNLAPATGEILDVTINIGGVSVIDNLALTSTINNSAAGRFFISNIGSGNAAFTYTPANVQPIIALNPDDTITISTTTVAVNTILYSYSYGE